MGSSFRWNDGGVGCRCRSALALRAWVPAFAGMTVEWFTAMRARAPRAWFPAFAGMTVEGFTAMREPVRYGPGSRLSPG